MAYLCCVNACIIDVMICFGSSFVHGAICVVDI